MRNEPRPLKNTPAQDLEKRKENNRDTARDAVAIALSCVKELDTPDIDFERLPRKRRFLSPQPQLMPSLASALLGIRPDMYPDKVAELIDHKNILLVGGGRSAEDLTSSKDFAPAALLNVDPFLPSENVVRQSAPYYRSSPLDPTSADFVREVRAEGYENFDEIWSTFSIPNYCKTSEEVTNFFRNMYEVLAPGGTIRIFPISIIVEKLEAAEKAQRIAAVSQGLSAALNALAERPDIEMSIRPDYASLMHQDIHTLKIHKLAAQE